MGGCTSATVCANPSPPTPRDYPPPPSLALIGTHLALLALLLTPILGHLVVLVWWGQWLDDSIRIHCHDQG